MKRKHILVGVLIVVGLVILVVYLIPPPRKTFAEIYQRVEPQTVASLQAFRQNYPPQFLEVNGVKWAYLVAGTGNETILFLHGMTGAYDIWWQQILALKDRYRIVSVTYPPVDSLAGLSQGILAILKQHGITQVNVVGTSLGGYLAQYLVAHHPTVIKRASFGNTFPPNNLIAERNRVLGTLLPFLPEWLIMQTFQQSGVNSIYPTSGKSELVLAFLMEQTYGGMSKAHIIARYRCVIEPFIAPKPTIPIMIIEADNDPLVEETLRTQLKTTYPTAKVHTLRNAGHFPYLNEASTYTRLLEDFLK
ncbi:MAG: alpha/beta hydrolase [Anaerolineae bacterium]|nr:alpha/beta hydrolase [Anaerolineae bacterium]